MTLNKSGLYTPQKEKYKLQARLWIMIRDALCENKKYKAFGNGRSDSNYIVLRIYQERGGKGKTVM